MGAKEILSWAPRLLEQEKRWGLLSTVRLIKHRLWSRTALGPTLGNL